MNGKMKSSILYVGRLCQRDGSHGGHLSVIFFNRTKVCIAKHARVELTWEEFVLIHSIKHYTFGKPPRPSALLAAVLAT